MINTMMLFLGGVGYQEILLIGLFILVFFGAKKTPEFMKGLGKGMKEFKEGMNEAHKEIDQDTSETKKDTK